MHALINCWVAMHALMSGNPMTPVQTAHLSGLMQVEIHPICKLSVVQQGLQ